MIVQLQPTGPMHSRHSSLAAAATLLLAVATPTRAQQPPRATDFAWLAGNWEGGLASAPGTTAQMTFQPANGGAVTGLMRILEGGKVVMIELISLVESPKGIELRFRHFDTDLKTYEPVFKQSMVLRQHAATVDTFENLEAYDKTLMSTQPRTASWTRHGPDELVSHSDIIGGDGKPGVVEVTYRRARW